jgi:Zn-dependent protease with chaperone function
VTRSPGPSAWSSAADCRERTRDSRAGVDLYVQPAGQLNAYAAGGRSVAVTTGVLEDW